MTQDRIQRLRPYLHDFDLPSLFIEELGWNDYPGDPVSVPVGDCDYELRPFAEKAGFAAYECAPGPDGSIPPYPVRRKIENHITKLAYEHLIIFVDAARAVQIWQWVRREPGRHAAVREQRFEAGQTGDALLQRVQELAVGLEEEGKIGITDVASRARKAFDVERVTKRFYERFRAELAAFRAGIDGIDDQGDTDWYASIMLNRMMFVYFIQKRGFLDGDADYLRNRLRMVQARRGNGRFQQFYRTFLLRLFHEGLGQPRHARAHDLSDLLGDVPFLNGGLFDVHDLERGNPNIDIPDEAFEKIFDFFDQYRWHLDERPSRADNEINPDVLGYIFEKYINQRQMGAYYTKEDITGYISRNTVIPFLFDAAKRACPIAFEPGGGVWRLLQDDPDRYIYPAAAHGTAWRYAPNDAPARIDHPTDLPPNIAAGIDDVSKRSQWNKPAPDEYALPTETWREVVARRQRYATTRAKLAAGGIHDIDELVTLNIDIQRFASDVIAQSEGPELLRAFWQAIQNASVLDPTCGSGAFLFAALNILEPIYADCIAAMRGFQDDLQRSNRPRHPETLRDFRHILERIDHHPNERYFILKSIILHNLYGVDIMEEAVEICKLRLFLKLAAQLDSPQQIEPLPDIDFNVRAGNTLVGFTSLDDVRNAMTITQDGQYRAPSDEELASLERIERSAQDASNAFDQFRSQQTAPDSQTHAQKADLRHQLERLADELDQYLAAEYNVDPSDTNAYRQWRTTHQPLHWFVEFHSIMNDGGFDIVIGNPPYLEFREVDYGLRGYTCLDTGAIHALCIERSVSILNNRGSVSMIVPLALPSTQRMKAVQDILEQEERTVWYANFAWRPAKLFDTVNRALTIFVAGHSNNPQTLSTRYEKWTSESRGGLLERIQFAQVSRNRTSFWVPKISMDVESSILEKLLSVSTSVADFIGQTDHRIFYRTDGGLYWKVFTDFPPAFSINGKKGHSSRETQFSVQAHHQVYPMIVSLSSDIFWWWYTITSNVRHLNPADIRGFPLPESIFTDAHLRDLADRYLADLVGNSTMLVRQQKQTGRTETQSFKIQKSKPIIDRIDSALAVHYGLTAEELDYIVNYDIKYRMGRGG